MADGEAHLGRDLLGLLEIVFGAQGQAAALDGGDPLVAVEVGALIEGHDEDALAEQAVGAGAGVIGGKGGELVLVIAAVAAESPLGAIVTDNVAHRAVALGLDDQPPVEFERRTDQGGQRAGLAQQFGDRRRIGMGRQHGVDSRTHADDAAAHGLAVNLEGGNPVVGQAGGVGHVGILLKAKAHR